MKKQKQIRSNWMFCICAAITASAGWLGLANTKPVLAAESVGEEMVVGNDSPDTGEGELSENALNTGGDENLGVYDFKDNKTTGTVTVTKVWDDDKTNEERAIPDIKISTTKPSKSTLGYTVTFHGNRANGLLFPDGSDVNNVVYNNSSKIISGQYKALDARLFTGWYTDETYTTKVEVSDEGIPQLVLTDDINLYGKMKTFDLIIHGSNNRETGDAFKCLIPSTTTRIIFCSEMMPKNAEQINGVDDDGDEGVVAWMEGTTMKVSTQVENQKVRVNGNADSLFENQQNLVSIDFSNLDTSGMTSMAYWFAYDPLLDNVDISGLNLYKVTDMSYLLMYGGGPNLHFQLNNLTLPNVKKIEYMFSRTNAVSVDLTGMNFPNATQIYYMFGYAKVKTIKMNNFKAPKCEIGYYFADECENLVSCYLDNADLSGITNFRSAFYQCPKLSNISMNGLDLSSLENADVMFSYCSSLKSIDFINGIKHFGDKNKNAYVGNMFSYCTALEIVDLRNLEVLSGASNVHYLFYACTSLTSANIDNANFSAATDANGLFSECNKLKSISAVNVNFSNIQNAGNMFSNLSTVKSINLSNANFSNVTNAYCMFSNNQSLETVNFTGVKLPNIQDAYSLFYECTSLKNIDMSSIICDTISNLSYMFYNCENIEIIDISGLSTSSVTNFSNMFAGCNNLKTLNAHIDTSSAKTLSNMFDSCYLLDKLDTSGFNTLNVTDMFALFADCKSLTEIDLSTFSTDKVTDMGYMFYGCESLSSLDVSLFNTENVTSMENMFINCNSLASLKTGKDFKFIGTNYSLSGTWQNTAGETFTAGNFPSNVADTYTKISD